VDASRVTRVRTGTENYSLHVLRELLALDRDNAYRLYLSSPLPEGLLPLNSRTTTRLIRLPRLWTHVGLSREMLRCAPDVLFVPSHVLPLVTPKRSVVVIYDVGHRVFPRAHAPRERLYLEWSIRRHVRIATRLLTISEASKQDLVRLYGADPARIDVAYPAVASSFKPAEPTDIARVRRAHGLGERYVLHLGTIKPRKNLPRLIHAFARAKLPPDTQLALGGMTAYGGAAVEEAISSTGLEQRVKRLAYVPDADLAALYSGAAAVAIVSLYEGFGMPALEALACAAPLLVSDRGSLPEIASNAAVVVDALQVASIARGLERLIADAPLREGLRERGLRRAAQFKWAAAAEVTRRALELATRPGADRRVPSPRPSAAS
jgi:glycosyltransferase involved in cell wall biosynthesis